MADLMHLIPLIYHEKQQAGSMLCAQHALNSLLQGPYFTAPDLSEIARNIDVLEESFGDSNIGASSANMDDTGFFSVQVLERALEVWGLSLVRWRSEHMRPYQDHPHTQLAFILNQQQHWYTLRRFGPAEANPDHDFGHGLWFNLDSCIEQPHWVGKLYLGMVLQQAEADGYSVFVVVQTDPSAQLALPRTQADDVAATLPEPSSSPSASHTTDFQSTPTSSAPQHHDWSGFDGLEDEDLELQAVLHASLGDHLGDQPLATPPDPPRLVRTSIPLPSEESNPSSAAGTGTHTPSQYSTPLLSPLGLNSREIDNSDPVAASMERNRRMLEQMRAEQEYAQRELWAEGGGPSSRRREEEEEEEEMLRRAIAESEAMAKVEGHGRPDDDDAGSAMDVEPSSTQSSSTSLPHGQHRVYDDDDAELQAALKASLEQMPEGWTPPAPQTPAASSINVAHSSSVQMSDADDDASVVTEDSDLAEVQSSPVIPATSIDVEEMRRKRLARFGG